MTGPEPGGARAAAAAAEREPEPRRAGTRVRAAPGCGDRAGDAGGGMSRGWGVRAAGGARGRGARGTAGRVSRWCWRRVAAGVLQSVSRWHRWTPVRVSRCYWGAAGSRVPVAPGLRAADVLRSAWNRVARCHQGTPGRTSRCHRGQPRRASRCHGVLGAAGVLQSARGRASRRHPGEPGRVSRWYRRRVAPGVLRSAWCRVSRWHRRGTGSGVRVAPGRTGSNVSAAAGGAVSGVPVALRAQGGGRVLKCMGSGVPVAVGIPGLARPKDTHESGESRSPRGDSGIPLEGTGRCDCARLARGYPVASGGEAHRAGAAERGVPVLGLLGRARRRLREEPCGTESHFWGCPRPCRAAGLGPGWSPVLGLPTGSGCSQGGSRARGLQGAEPPQNRASPWEPRAERAWSWSRQHCAGSTMQADLGTLPCRQHCAGKPPAAHAGLAVAAFRHGEAAGAGREVGSVTFPPRRCRLLSPARGQARCQGLPPARAGSGLQAWARAAACTPKRGICN